MIAARSSSLTKYQRNYSIIELEAMSIVYALERCRYYLAGIRKSFTIFTNHKPLKFIFSHKK